MSEIKIGIMQPYFLPYIGYWQLMNMVDKYVIYDNIEYTKNSWIRRNRFLVGGHDKLFSLPLKKDSDFLDVRDRFLSGDFEKEKDKLLQQIRNSYQKAPMFQQVFPIIREIFDYSDTNLFGYIYHSVVLIREYLGIESELIVSSTLNIGKELKGKEKVLGICRALGATDYYNSVNGIPLYAPYRDDFARQGIALHFPKVRNITYNQFDGEFVPALSIIDVMMFNSRERCHELLQEYDFVEEVES